MSRNAKIFIYISLFIHLSCGVALYMYYFNPSAPQPLGKDREEQPQPEMMTLNSFKTSPSKALRAVKKKSSDKNKTVKNKTPSLKVAKSPAKSPERSKPSVASSQKERASEKETKKTQTPSKEANSLSGTTDSSISGKGKNGKNFEGKIAPVESKAGNAPENTSPTGEKKASVSKGISEKEKAEKAVPKEKIPSPPSDSSLGKTDLKAEDQQPEIKISKASSPKNFPPTDQNEKSKESLPNSITENPIPDNKNQKTSPNPTIPLQKKTVPVKEKEKEQNSSNKDLKQPSSSSGFRDFVDMKPKRGNPSLDYPYEAREQKMQGRVSIIYFVTPEGLVDQIQLEKSSGHSLLDNFVLRTVARYEFFPQQEGWVRHTVEFILKGEEVQNLKMRDKE